MYLKGITAAFAMLDFFFPFFFFLKMVDKLLVSVNYKTVNSNIWLSVFRFLSLQFLHVYMTAIGIALLFSASQFSC